MFYNFFDKRSSGSGSGVSCACSETLAIQYKSIMQNQQIAEELQKLIITKFEKRKIHSSLIGNIWGADPANMLLTSKYNEGLQFLLCVLMFVINMHGLLL